MQAFYTTDLSLCIADRGGFRVTHVYRADPDYPERLSPLVKPGVGVTKGDVIEMINGVATLSVSQPAALLRNQAGRQVLLPKVSSASGWGK